MIEPASKVSVPFTVVMRTRSRVPERVTVPPKAETIDVASVPLQTQVLFPKDAIIANPLLIYAAFERSDVINPAVLVKTPVACWAELV